MIPAEANLIALFREKATTIRVLRDDGLDIVFDGWMVSQGSVGDAPERDEWTRWTTVTVYVTESRKYVIATERGSRGGTPLRHAIATSDFEEAKKWLYDNNRGRVGQATATAIRDAGSRLPWLAEATIERV
jgi:hypothetical protein